MVHDEADLTHILEEAPGTSLVGPHEEHSDERAMFHIAVPCIGICIKGGKRCMSVSMLN